MPREIHADVNTEVSLVECLREIDEREAKHDEWWLLMAMVSKQILIVFWRDSYWRFIKGLREGESRLLYVEGESWHILVLSSLK